MGRGEWVRPGPLRRGQGQTSGSEAPEPVGYRRQEGWDLEWKRVRELVFDETIDEAEAHGLNFRGSQCSRTGVFDLPEVEGGWLGARNYASFWHTRKSAEDLSVFLRTLRRRLLGRVSRG